MSSTCDINKLPAEAKTVANDIRVCGNAHVYGARVSQKPCGCAKTVISWTEEYGDPSFDRTSTVIDKCREHGFVDDKDDRDEEYKFF